MEQLSGSHDAPVGLAVVGASAGGVEALKVFAAGLPADLNCPVVVVLHVSSKSTSVLPQILERAGVLPASAAADGDVARDGHLYVAPPDSHVLVAGGVLRLSGGPRENGHRPAVDPTMRSAAEDYDGRTVGIVLSGTRDDGTAGLAAIKAHGGRVVVQDPDEALYPGMPANALAHVTVDAVLPVAGIARWLADAARPGGGTDDSGTPAPTADGTSFASDGPPGAGTRFTCPECGGVLFEVSGAGALSLQCPVGHVYSPDSLAAEQGHELERALWTATRALDDRVALLERMATRARGRQLPRAAAAFARQAEDAREHAVVIRRSLERFTETSSWSPASVTGADAR